ncbi:virulence RhuM family protein [Candidatus Saccharibacteria bacterium]|nr:virulence RhuM family protein [Candidatus Saccharibacteria bacterium]
MENGLVKYEVEEGEVIFDIDRDKETIWATQEEMAKIFDVDRTVIGRHLRNIFKDNELDEEQVCAKNAHTAADGKTYLTKFYNLDAIISVGYRVNSRKATKFRVWATNVLKRYVVDGAAVNERRIRKLPDAKLENLEGTLSMVRRLMAKTELEEGEAKGILEVISRYGKTVEIIQEYDDGEASVFSKTGKMRRTLTLAEVKNLAENLREQLNKGSDFGELKDEANMEELLNSLALNKMGKTVAEKSAKLLYYVINSEPFIEGNRQIGALMFIYFLTINDCHLSADGETKISDRALTAIVLLISESEPEEKELIIDLITKLLS